MGLGQPGLIQAFIYYFIKSYSRDNSVILNNIQAYDLDVELGLFFLSLKHTCVCSTLTAYLIWVQTGVSQVGFYLSNFSFRFSTRGISFSYFLLGSFVNFVWYADLYPPIIRISVLYILFLGSGLPSLVLVSPPL